MGHRRRLRWFEPKGNYQGAFLVGEEELPRLVQYTLGKWGRLNAPLKRPTEGSQLRKALEAANLQANSR